jgi:hypothetical protein
MNPKRPARRSGLVCGSLLLAAAAALLGAVPAGAASGGAGAPDVPVANGGGTPSGQSVLCTISIPAAGGGGTCSGVKVAAGPTTDGLSVVISVGAGPSCAVGQAIGVSFVDPVTNLAAAALTPPATITYTDSAITTSDSVLVYDSASGGWVLPPSGGVSGGSTSAGSVSASMTADGSFVADASTCSSAIGGATVAVTGKPFRGEEWAAGLLIAGGVVALVLALRRRRPAHA